MSNSLKFFKNNDFTLMYCYIYVVRGSERINKGILLIYYYVCNYQCCIILRISEIRLSIQYM